MGNYEDMKEAEFYKQRDAALADLNRVTASEVKYYAENPPKLLNDHAITRIHKVPFLDRFGVFMFYRSVTDLYSPYITHGLNGTDVVFMIDEDMKYKDYEHVFTEMLENISVTQTTRGLLTKIIEGKF